MELHLSEAIVPSHTQSLFNSSEDAMSKKIKLQDLSISNFDQRPDVEGIKGGGPKLICEGRKRCIKVLGRSICQPVVYCYVTR